MRIGTVNSYSSPEQLDRLKGNLSQQTLFYLSRYFPACDDSDPRLVAALTLPTAKSDSIR